MRLLNRLRQHVAQRELEVWTVVFPAAIVEHRQHTAHAVLPDRLLILHLPIERPKFGDARTFAHAELDPAVADQIEEGNLLGDARRVVGGQLDDAMTQADMFRALAGGGEKHLGLWGVGILLQKVMLDLPGVMVAQSVGQFDLRKGVLIKRLLGVRFPGAWTLQLVKDTEFHGSPFRDLATDEYPRQT